MAKQPTQDAENQPDPTDPVDPAVEAASEGRPSASEYKTTGTTVVKARRGHAVVPANEKLPVVGEEGVKMSKSDADAVVEQWPDYAYIEKED